MKFNILCTLQRTLQINMKLNRTITYVEMQTDLRAEYQERDNFKFAMQQLLLIHILPECTIRRIW